MTTIDTLTDDQIRTLRTEAGEAGDMLQVAICDVALFSGWSLEDYRDTLTPPQIETLRGLDKPEARALCAQTIAAAEAHADGY